MRAYHFVGKTLRDGRPVPPDGEWLVHAGAVVMCKSGLHASVHPFDALMYAPGETLCLVDIESEPAGEFRQDTDKVVGTRRRIVKRIDATDLLRSFARECALSVVHLWDAPPVVVEYLKTGDPALREAAAAEVGAAEVGAAAEAAVWAAAEMGAAEAAVWAAAEVGAAEAAAEAAAWVVEAEAVAAAEAAVRAAAWAAGASAAVRAAEAAGQRKRFADLVDAAFSLDAEGPVLVD